MAFIAGVYAFTYAAGLYTPPMRIRYRVVDVFTCKPLEGNPLGVFPETAELDGATMQKLARELNLSETVFFVQPERAGCDAGVRIFTPSREMLFAGHPTIGASFVLLDEGLIKPAGGRFVLDEKVGPVPIRVEPGERPLIWLRTPPIAFGKKFDRSLAAAALGLAPADLLDFTPQLVSAGNPTVFVALKDPAAVDRSWLDANAFAELKAPGDEPVCIFVFTPTREGAYSRMFAPEYGIIEDPATGSSTGPLAAYMIENGLISGADGSRLISEQGTKMGRRSILHIEIHGARGAQGIDVGGYVTPLVEAAMTL